MTKIQVVATTFFDKVSEKTEVHFYSDACGALQSSELWAGLHSGNFLVLHQDAYYDENLVKRRNEGNILSGWAPTERMVFVGSVWKNVQEASPSKIFLGQSSIEALVYGT